MAQTVDNLNFADILIDRYGVLDNAIDWIKENLNPEDVFDTDQLDNWAKNNGFIIGDD